MKQLTKETRAREFLECLGNGKTIYQIESEEELIEEQSQKDMKQEDFL
jgi:hypothetical protein